VRGGALPKNVGSKKCLLTFKKYYKTLVGLVVKNSEQRVANNKHRDLIFMHVYVAVEGWLGGLVERNVHAVEVQIFAK